VAEAPVQVSLEDRCPIGRQHFINQGDQLTSRGADLALVGHKGFVAPLTSHRLSMSRMVSLSSTSRTLVMAAVLP
jgi:hypothetical protein